MKALFRVKSALLLVTAIMSLGISQQAEAASSLTIQQQSSINRVGRWELTTPTSFLTSRNKTQTITSQPDGTYELVVLPPHGAKTSISFMDGTTILRTVDGAKADFELIGDMNITILVNFNYSGTVTVTSDPPGANFELKGSTDIRLTGTTPATFTDMPPYYYTVSYSLVEDCQLPKPQSRALETNSIITFNADFICANELPVAAPKDPAPANVDRADQINVRLWNSFHQAEAVPGSSVLVTVGVRNISTSTIHNLKLSESFDPNLVTMPVVLPGGGTLQDFQIGWEIPQIFAGQSWTATFPVTLKDNLTVGKQVQLVSHVSGNEIRSPRGELLSEITSVGIASMPETGSAMARNVALLIAGVALILTFSIRRKSHVVSIV